jgi:hypothetical protein
MLLCDETGIRKGTTKALPARTSASVCGWLHATVDAILVCARLPCLVKGWVVCIDQRASLPCGHTYTHTLRLDFLWPEAGAVCGACCPTGGESARFE